MAPRLKTVRPVLAPAPAALPSAPADGAARASYRDATTPGRSWYDTARWKALRLKVLRRDGWQCRQTGELLVGRAGAWNSPVVDHIVPHRGDEALFWDEDNLQSVTKRWHDSDKQRQDHRGET
jgi:5-methylcytosine-specific restriction endonuclease McrA